MLLIPEVNHFSGNSETHILIFVHHIILPLQYTEEIIKNYNVYIM